MSPCVQIIQRIEDDVETLKPIDVELRVLDVGMVGFELDIRIEFGGAVFRNLEVNVMLACACPEDVEVLPRLLIF